jgi:tetratricopeptide (TPR) repeat protein
MTRNRPHNRREYWGARGIRFFSRDHMMRELFLRRPQRGLPKFPDLWFSFFVLGCVVGSLICNPLETQAALIDKAMGSWAAGDPVEARRLARAVLAEEPSNARALLLMARTEPGGRTAQSWAEQAIAAAEGRPPGDEATLFLIEAYASTKSYGAIAERAQRFFREFSRNNEYADAVRWWAAIADLKLNRPTAADETLRPAVENPQSSDWSRRLRLLYADSRTDAEQQIGAYRDLLRVNDAFIESQSLLGLIRAYERLGETDRVILYRGILAEKYPSVELDLTGAVTSTARQGPPADNEAERLADIAYTVQLGAFSDKKNAEQLRNKYQKSGYTVHFFSRTVAGKKYWVVQVGSMASLEKARQLQETLEREDKATYRVVVR